MSVRNNRNVSGALIRLVITAIICATGTFWITARTVAQEDSSRKPRPVRNDIAQGGQEVLMLRHQKLQKGSHQAFYDASREGVWPFYEKIGARIIGQWKVIYPPARRDTESPDYDEVITMTRYASYEHWKATQPSESAKVGGNGPDWEKMMEAFRFCQSLSFETSVQFLQGYIYSSPPIYMPGLNERYELLKKNASLR